MEKIFGVLRVGHIDDRGSVVLGLAVERIEARPGMMGHIGDFPVTLVDYERLVRRPALEVVVAHQIHVPGGLLIPGTRCRWRGRVVRGSGAHREEYRNCNCREVQEQLRPELIHSVSPNAAFNAPRGTAAHFLSLWPKRAVSLRLN